MEETTNLNMPLLSSGRPTLSYEINAAGSETSKDGNLGSFSLDELKAKVGELKQLQQLCIEAIELRKYYLFSEKMDDMFIEPVTNNPLSEKFIEYAFHTDLGRIFSKMLYLTLIQGLTVTSLIFSGLAITEINYLVTLYETTTPDHVTPMVIAFATMMMFNLAASYSNNMFSFELYETDSERRYRHLMMHKKRD